MFKVKKYFSIFAIVLIMLFSIPIACYANSAEPPSLAILVSNAPKDLKIEIGNKYEYKTARKIENPLETQFIYYHRELSDVTDCKLKATGGGYSFEIELDKDMLDYSTLYTLNLKKHELIKGKATSRTVILISLRVGLTLVIEGIIFFMYGFRKRKSWIAFSLINLFTQGGLNILLNMKSPFVSYAIFSLFFGEIMVFIIELILFSLFVKEKSKGRLIGYVLVANFVSLILGGYIITVLPI